MWEGAFDHWDRSSQEMKMVEKSDESGGFEARGRGRGTRTGGDKLILAGAFGHPMPAEEQAMWNTLSPEKRQTAAARLGILLKYESIRPITPEDAAAQLDISLNRWYEMFAAWREKRSLSSIGIFADVPRSRTLSHHNDVQRLVIGVVDADPNGSVRRLAIALGEAYGKDTGLPESEWPTYMTFRKFVEAELRRRMKEEAPGNDVAFDCCACELPHITRIFAAFLIIDRGSRIVLGAALGDARASHAGYALAAKDALERIKQGSFDRLDWSDDLERSEIVIGLDEEAWAGHRDEMAAAGMKAQLQPATKARRFGAYVRPLIGPRMGRVKFVPGKTFSEPAFAKAGPDDVARFGVEVDAYNAELMPGDDAERGRVPPTKLTALLKRLSKR